MLVLGCVPGYTPFLSRSEGGMKTLGLPYVNLLNTLTISVRDWVHSKWWYIVIWGGGEYDSSSCYLYSSYLRYMMIGGSLYLCVGNYEHSWCSKGDSELVPLFPIVVDISLEVQCF